MTPEPDTTPEPSPVYCSECGGTVYCSTCHPEPAPAPPEWEDAMIDPKGHIPPDATSIHDAASRVPVREISIAPPEDEGATTDAVEILTRRYYGGDPNHPDLVAARAEDEGARLVAEMFALEMHAPEGWVKKIHAFGHRLAALLAQKDAEIALRLNDFVDLEHKVVSKQNVIARLEAELAQERDRVNEYKMRLDEGAIGFVEGTAESKMELRDQIDSLRAEIARVEAENDAFELGLKKALEAGIALRAELEQERKRVDSNFRAWEVVREHLEADLSRLRAVCKTQADELEYGASVAKVAARLREAGKEAPPDA